MKTITVAAVSAAVATVMSVATVALAGSGVGGVFNLGQSNSVDATTSLTGNTPGGAELQVTNSASASSIRGNSNGGTGVLGTHTSSSGADAGVEGDTSSTDPNAVAMLADNNGGGSALKLNVNGSAPPLVVNSSGKVANLNADKLDGISAGGFVQGKGTILSNAITQYAGTGTKTLLVIPRIGVLTTKCKQENGETHAEIDYKNTTSTTFDVADEVDGGATSMIGFVQPNQTIVSILDHRTQWFRWLFSKNQASGPVAEVQSVKAPFYNGACIFQAIATVQL